MNSETEKNLFAAAIYRLLVQYTRDANRMRPVMADIDKAIDGLHSEIDKMICTRIESIKLRS